MSVIAIVNTLLLLTLNHWNYRRNFNDMSNKFEYDINKDGTILLMNKKYSMPIHKEYKIHPHACHEKMSALISKDAIFIYPSYNWTDEVILAYSKYYVGIILNITNNCHSKCQNGMLDVGNHSSRICHEQDCLIGKGLMKIPFDLSLKGEIIINKTIISCKLRNYCTYFTDSYYLPQCNSFWGNSLLAIIMTLILCLALSVFIFIPMLIKCIKVRKERQMMIKNSRIKKIKGKIVYIPNSKMKNHSAIKSRNRHIFSLVILMLIGSVLSVCDNTFDVLTYQEDCTINSTCQHNTHGTLFYTHTDMNKCFADEDGKLYAIRLLRVEYKCNEDVDYYVPSYTVHSEEEWRCTWAGGCMDGVFTTHPNGTFYLEFATESSYLDACFMKFSKRCKRINLKFNNLRHVCAVKSCSSFRPILHLSLHYGSEEMVKILELEESITWHNISITGALQDGSFSLHSLIDCGEYYLKRTSNARNEYNRNNFGMIQCPTERSAIELDTTKCKTDVTSMLTVLEDTALISESDILSTAINYGSRIPKENGVKSLFDITDNTVFILQIKTNKTVIRSAIDDPSGDITSLKLTGMMGSYNKAAISYTCSKVNGVMYLRCPPFYSTSLTCKTIGDNIMQTSVDINKMPSQVMCEYQIQYGVVQKVVLTINLTINEVVIYDTNYIDDDYSKTSASVFDQFSIKNLFIQYLIEYKSVIIPAVSIVAALIFRRIYKTFF